MVPKPQGESQATPRSRTGKAEALRQTPATSKLRPVPRWGSPHVPLPGGNGPPAAQFRVHRIGPQHPAVTVGGLV